VSDHECCFEKFAGDGGRGDEGLGIHF
jgi:hypothetical protein